MPVSSERGSVLRRLPFSSLHHAATAPRSTFAELEVVRRCYARPVNESRQATESAIEKLRLAATRRHFDLLPSSELPQLAMSALEAGLDSPSLRHLAGELHPTWADSGPLFERVLNDFGIDTLSRPQAGHALARYYAEQIVSGTISPYEGARRIWWDVANAVWNDREVWKQYSLFVGLASEWEDYPPGRPDYEQQIRDEAKQLLNRNA